MSRFRTIVFLFGFIFGFNAVASAASLIFFSTETGDAWMLDYEDGLALCLAKDGDTQTFRIVETSEKFAIDLNVNFHIEGAQFVVIQQSGLTRTILGYPTSEILETIRRVS